MRIVVMNKVWAVEDSYRVLRIFSSENVAIKWCKKMLVSDWRFEYGDDAPIASFFIENFEGVTVVTYKKIVRGTDEPQLEFSYTIERHEVWSENSF